MKIITYSICCKEFVYKARTMKNVKRFIRNNKALRIDRHIQTNTTSHSIIIYRKPK